eukprot:TRINITY_DN11058_c0_g1_i1.p1 TRINITY_DN11058_c0_g1~~TRINITY_DN11058_c0_g1_i1.p1  ORF type:complete len:501 (+),score=184.64 TRINITY_DN11058_c0_g1_i1:85-1503(+)
MASVYLDDDDDDDNVEVNFDDDDDVPAPAAGPAGAAGAAAPAAPAVAGTGAAAAAPPAAAPAAPPPGGAAAGAAPAVGADGDCEMDADEWDQQMLGASVVAGTVWTLWFDADLTKGLTLKEYKDNITEVGDVEDLDKLRSLRVYNNFDFVPEDESLRTGRGQGQNAQRFRFNLRLFRRGVQPFWEDPAHRAGLIITLRMPESIPPIQFQLFWKALSRSIVARKCFNCDTLVDEDDGEENEPFDTAGLNGVVVHYGRNKGHGLIEVWCQEIGPSSERLLHTIKEKIIPQGKYRFTESFKSVQTCLSENASARRQQARGLYGGASAGPELRKRKDAGLAPLRFQKWTLGGAHAKGRFDPYHKALDKAFRKECMGLSTAFEREQLRSGLKEELRRPSPLEMQERALRHQLEREMGVGRVAGGQGGRPLVAHVVQGGGGGGRASVEHVVRGGGGGGMMSSVVQVPLPDGRRAFERV